MSSYPNGITQELISAAQQLLFAMAYERHVGPIVIDYETEILKRLQLRRQRQRFGHGDHLHRRGRFGQRLGPYRFVK